MLRPEAVDRVACVAIEVYLGNLTLVNIVRVCLGNSTRLRNESSRGLEPESYP